MNGAPKITLSAEELQLAANTEWILTKRTIIETAVQLFGQLAAQYKFHLQAHALRLPEAVIQSSPKITKGENYQLLPYVILDYPRCFQKEQVFAIRTMFWWGKSVSITLHVSDNYAAAGRRALQDEELLQQFQHYYLCVNDKEWEHHFEPDNYQPVAKLNSEQVQHIATNSPFIKLAVPFTLQQWNALPELLEKEWVKLIQLAAH
jgi:hypothetical protein